MRIQRANNILIKARHKSLILIQKISEVKIDKSELLFWGLWNLVSKLYFKNKKLNRYKNWNKIMKFISFALTNITIRIFYMILASF